jgi:hypothetical protein
VRNITPHSSHAPALCHLVRQEDAGASTEAFQRRALERYKKDNMYLSAKRGFATATYLADYLVRKGIAFRDTHQTVGLAVRLGVDTRRIYRNYRWMNYKDSPR